jgi:hypothetical protein
MTRVVLGSIAASRRRTAAAVPTVLGYSTKGSVNASGLSDGRIYVSLFTLAAPGTLQELHGWFSGSGSDSAGLVIYAANGSGGLPGTRLAYKAPIFFPAGDYEMVQTGLSVALPAANYWVGFTCSSGVGGSCRGEDPGGTHQGIIGGAPVNPPPNPFGTPETSGSRKHSCWGIVLV